MLRIVPLTVARVGRSYEHFPDGFELHLLLDRSMTPLAWLWRQLCKVDSANGPHVGCVRRVACSGTFLVHTDPGEKRRKSFFDFRNGPKRAFQIVSDDNFYEGVA